MPAFRFQLPHQEDSDFLSSVSKVGNWTDDQNILIVQYRVDDPDDQGTLENLIDRHMYIGHQTLSREDEYGNVVHMLVEPLMRIPLENGTIEIKYKIHARAWDK